MEDAVKVPIKAIGAETKPKAIGTETKTKKIVA
jgi:hypothetical protein